MQIQEGKFYKTRDGQKVGPMVKSGILYGLISGGILEYYENGQKSHVYDMDDDIIEEWTDTPTIWEDMTREEKGALLLAAFEGKRIECIRLDHHTSWYETLSPQWDGELAYRVKPEPKRETVKRSLRGAKFMGYVAIDMVDDAPQWDTMRPWDDSMERLT